MQWRCLRHAALSYRVVHILGSATFVDISPTTVAEDLKSFRAYNLIALHDELEKANAGYVIYVDYVVFLSRVYVCLRRAVKKTSATALHEFASRMLIQDWSIRSASKQALIKLQENHVVEFCDVLCS